PDGGIPTPGKSGGTPGETPPPGGLPGLVCSNGSTPTLSGCPDGGIPIPGKSGETPPGGKGPKASLVAGLADPRCPTLGTFPPREFQTYSKGTWKFDFGIVDGDRQ